MVYPGVDTALFHPAEKRLGPPRLLTVGRLMKRKGHDRVLQALPELLKEFPDLRYQVAGVGAYESVLRGIVQCNGLQAHVTFLGKVPDRDLPHLLQETTVFVHPNRTTEEDDVEGFGIVFLEAAACGVPVVGGRSGGVPDAVSDGHNGLLVDDDPAELLEALRRLLRDPNLRQQMGSAGISWARRFTWGKAAQQIWDCAAQCLKLDTQVSSSDLPLA